MARSIFVNGWNIPIRLDDFNFIESARNGEVGTGGFNLDSENAGVSINSHWGVTALETSSSNTNLYHGYVADLDIARGPYAIDKDRQYDTNIVDLNTLLIDDIITGSSGNRPEESDIARVTWLVGTSFLNGMGSTIGASGATTLEAADYRTQTPLDLLTQAAETAGKLFFVYYDYATSAPKLFYDLATASNFITSSKISTFLADGSNATTHHPRKDSLHRSLDGGRIYSELLYKYDGGSVTVTNAATASNYRSRKTVIYDNFTKTAAHATRKANQYLNSVSTPEEVITLDVDLTASQINEFRAGQLMQIKAPHLGLPTFVDRRIVRTEKKPRYASGPKDQEDYTVTMELSIPKANKFGSSGVPTEALPDEVTETPSTAPADRDCTGTGGNAGPGVQYWHVVRLKNGTDLFEANGTGSASEIGSGIYLNTAYYAAGCPIGGGGWDASATTDRWYPISLPADSDQLGILLSINGSALSKTGAAQGYNVKIAEGPPHQGNGASVAGGQFVDFTVAIDRSLLRWGTTMYVVLSPNWVVNDCGPYLCNAAVYFGNPMDDGRLGSGAIQGTPTQIPYTTCTFETGTGLADWVGGSGIIDGSNTTFRLINWSGDGGVYARMNGQDIPVLSTDTGALTATVGEVPYFGDELLFQYEVDAP